MRTNSLGFSAKADALLTIAMQDARWALWTIDLRSGAARILFHLPFPASTSVAGFSFLPSKGRMATGILTDRTDLWIMENFAPPSVGSRLRGLLGW